MQLLTQISGQLAASANGTAFRAPPFTSFTPATTSLLCNALCFLSLGFSLTCALIATLVQQWAREFLHKAEMRPAPLVRARVFSYLYYGLKRFQMHSVVEIIPLLLHASLLLFFGGLVAFLIPVNSIMTWICATILFVVGSVYSLVTVLPLWCMDCPYHTPLSIGFWRLMRTVWRFWPQRNSQENNTAQPPSLRDETMVEATFRAAVKRSAQRSAQDSRAIVWTIKSLADDDELEPFVEAIPVLLWGPSGRHYAYLDHVRNLARHPDVRLHNRLTDLLASCGTGLLPLGVSQRRRITCYRAIWAVASLATFPQPSEASEPAADIGSKFSRYLHEQSAPSMTSESAPYFASARTMSIWSLYCTVKDRLPGLRNYLTRCDSSNLTPVTSVLPDIHMKFVKLGLGLTPLWGSTISELQQMSRELDLLLPYRLVFQYLRQSASLTHAPYRWEETWTAISVDPSVPFIDLQHPLEFALDSVISAQLGRINAASDVANVDWIYKNISAPLAFWRPEHSSAIPGAVVGLLNGTTSEVVLREILRIGEIEIHLWSNFPRTLSEGPSNPPFLFRSQRCGVSLPSTSIDLVATIPV